METVSFVQSEYFLLTADQMIMNESLRGVPLLLLANKQDLEVMTCATMLF